ncbi:MAG TPA: AAA family ATPase [Blastocatellia bacterium]|nr:AAA family ATPase [Blastocatellia bacterium]
MKVITCFSYKGGAARTTAAANIAAALASVRGGVGSIQSPLGRKVALIDLDVFSAGTHRVFEIDEKRDFKDFSPFIQDYLREQMSPATYVDRGGIQLTDPLMRQFRLARGGADNCHPEFTLFPAKPDPRSRFVVQKQHENVLIELLVELESRGRDFDYVVLDGESGTRQMADIALRLADIVLVFFRLTWQHIDGTLNTAEDFQKNPRMKPYYLVPTCVPLVGEEDKVYREDAVGLLELRDLTGRIPEASDLNRFAEEHPENAGLFWAGVAGAGERLCIHESLCLKGEERIIVFDEAAHNDRAAKDFYRIAEELNDRHGPSD